MCPYWQTSWFRASRDSTRYGHIIGEAGENPRRSALVVRSLIPRREMRGDDRVHPLNRERLAQEGHRPHRRVVRWPAALIRITRIPAVPAPITATPYLLRALAILFAPLVSCCVVVRIVPENPIPRSLPFRDGALVAFIVRNRKCDVLFA